MRWPSRAIRVARCCSGVEAVDSGPITVVLRPRAGYDTAGLRELRREGDAWTGRAGDLHMRWSGARAPGRRPRASNCASSCGWSRAGTTTWSWNSSDDPLPDEPTAADQAWRTTETGWRSSVPALDGLLAPT